jgi:hypothetical protein
MRNSKDGWTANDWEVIEADATTLLGVAIELDHAVGAGGGDFTHEELRALAVQAEAIGKRLRELAGSYF